MRSGYLVAALAVTVAAAGCGDSTGPAPRPSVTECRLEMLSGDGQTVMSGTLLPAPLVVRVTDLEGGAVPNTIIVWGPYWRYTDQGFRRTGWTSRTDRDGVAQTQFIPSEPGAPPLAADAAECESPAIAFSLDVLPADWPALGDGTSLLYAHVGDEGDFRSRYVLEPDTGTFRLQYRFCCFAYEYAGVYAVQGADVLFDFRSYRDWIGGSGEFQGRAFGTLVGDRLTVHYDEGLRYDFGDDTVYELVP